MSRVPRADVESGNEESKKFSDRVKTLRRVDIVGGRVPNLFAILHHRPNIAEAFLGLATQLRQQGVLSDRIRELVIMYVALLTKTAHLWTAHLSHSIKAGLDEAALYGMADDWTPFDDRDRAALAYAKEMTVQIDVTRATFDAVARHFNNAEVVELTALIGLYNMTNRIIHALAVEEDEGRAKSKLPFVDPLEELAASKAGGT